MAPAELESLWGLRIIPAGPIEWSLCAGALVRFHYLHTFPDPRGMPLVYSVRLGEEWVGTLVYTRPESNRCYQGGLTYGSAADIAAGRAEYDRWEVLNLARVWLSPAFQTGGSRCDPDTVPGFFDRRGVFRSTLASTVVRESMNRIRLDYLLRYPPCFLEEPYQLKVVLSYCDTRVHRGVLYRSSGFTLARRNRDGIETWKSPDLPPLDEAADAEVRRASRTSSRSQRKRAARGLSPNGMLF